MGKLVVEAAKGVTDLVQAVHGAIGGAPARLFSAPVYSSIRGHVIGNVLSAPSDAVR